MAHVFQPMHSIAETLRHLQQAFTCNPAGEPALEARILLAHVLEKPTTHLIAWPEKLLTSSQQQHIQSLAARRINGEPIAHILGKREFWSLDFKITPATLIPRPDTELLVEQALSIIPKNANWQIADLGTGSGIIAIAIASERPECHFIATDQSTAALKVAEENIQKNALKNITTVAGNWCAALLDRSAFDLILSNPPYIAAGDSHLNQGDLRFEPTSALVSGVDGLDDIRKIIEQARHYLKPAGQLMLEHGYHQGNSVRNELKTFGYERIATYRDTGDNERVTTACR